MFYVAWNTTKYHHYSGSTIVRRKGEQKKQQFFFPARFEPEFKGHQKEEESE